MAHTLGAFTWVNFVDFLTHADCAVGALGLAHVAIDAFIRND